MDNWSKRFRSSLCIEWYWPKKKKKKLIFASNLCSQRALLTGRIWLTRQQKHAYALSIARWWSMQWCSGWFQGAAPSDCSAECYVLVLVFWSFCLCFLFVLCKVFISALGWYWAVPSVMLMLVEPWCALDPGCLSFKGLGLWRRNMSFLETILHVLLSRHLPETG